MSADSHKPAAQYVRMSTDQQHHSVGDQIDAIRTFAEANDLRIVRTYIDEGITGLNIRRRAALQQLLEDVERGDAGFEVIVVYDVSRLGRFPDPDEVAYRTQRSGRTAWQIAALVRRLR